MAFTLQPEADIGPDHHQPRYQLTPGERAELAKHAARCGICLSTGYGVGDGDGHCFAYRDMEWQMERDGKERNTPTVEVPVLKPEDFEREGLRRMGGGR